VEIRSIEGIVQHIGKKKGTNQISQSKPQQLMRQSFLKGQKGEKDSPYNREKVKDPADTAREGEYLGFGERKLTTMGELCEKEN